MWTPFRLREHVKPVTMIVLTCFGMYVLFWSGHHYSIDGIIMFEYAKALLFQRSFIMDPPVVWGGNFQVSIWPIGQTLMYMPILALLAATVMHGKPNVQQIPYRTGESYYFKLMDNPAYQYASLSIPFITALTAGLVYVLGIQSGLSKKMSAAAALVFGLASPAAVFARFDYAQPLASGLLLLAIVLAVQSVHKSYAHLFWAGMCMGLAILTRPETILYGGPAILAIAWAARAGSKTTARSGPVFRLLLLAGIMGAFVVLNQAINNLRFGSLWSVGYRAASGNSFVLSLTHIATGLIGNTISPGRGLLLFFPISLLSLWGGWQVRKRSGQIAFVLGSISALAVLLYSAWSQWAAGMTWGPRFLIPILPYITILAFWGARLPGRMPAWLRIGLPAGLILAGWLVSLQGQLFDFLGFYGSKNLSDAELMVGAYNFRWSYSPIVAGWQWGFTQPTVDSYWIQALSHGSLEAGFVVGAILLTLVAAAMYWFNFFRLPAVKE